MNAIRGEVLKTIERVHELFKKRGLSLSVAESCTGGLISHYITSLPGSSVFFDSGVTSYSEASKQNILGVSQETISAHGAVSRETAWEMAEKMRDLTKTDYTVSTTGNLGPELLEGKDRGLVYMAVCGKNKTSVREFRFRGERVEIKEAASHAALKFLLDEISIDSREDSLGKKDF